jgi:asparagine synthase (glutamine-hydrolysing)
MCGIAGFIDRSASTSAADLHAQVRQMADAIRYRGPDSDGYWEDSSSGVALGHRRLAILDLSPAGHQPMRSATGRFVVVFNGEIYNFQEIRKELLSCDPTVRFRGHSDTEVMLAAFELWGVRDSLPRFNGMFAFAVWDREQRSLHLARDRMGEKPLYYSFQGSTFLFGSELKALRAHPEFNAPISRSALAQYFAVNCVPGTLSIYEGVQKLPPGSTLTIQGDKEPKVETFWTIKEAVQQGAEQPFRGSDDDAIDQLDILLRDAVRLRMLADVPLGVFLSGGIDSSTVTALMQVQSNRPVRTFSIGFGESEFDESLDARRVAQLLGTEHTELIVSPADAREVIPLLPAIYDEPFGDSSQIPTHLVAKMTRQYVTVALSGDGGDELFGGYNRHLWVSRIWNKVGRSPRILRRLIGGGLSSVSPETWDRILSAANNRLPSKAKQRNRGEKIHKLAGIIGASNAFSMYSRLTAHCADPSSLVLGDFQAVPNQCMSWLSSLDIAEQMMILDATNYLPDDILVKVDRAAMAVSLEGRIPFLDHRVIEFAYSLPLSLKIREGEGKWIVRRLLNRYVRRELFERPKMGFAVPLGAWLRGPLRDWAESLLAEDRLRQEGFLNPKQVRARWNKVLKGIGNGQFHIWDILMFQAWLESISKTGSLR